MLLFSVATISFISMTSTDTVSDNTELTVDPATHFFSHTDFTPLDDAKVEIATCSSWSFYSQQNCNCTESHWSAWFHKTKYRRWCHPNVAYGHGLGWWQYTPWTCNIFCREK